MYWTFHLCRLWGVDVRIHWSLPVVFLFFILRASHYGASLQFLGLFVVLPYLLLFVSVLLHEFGHVAAARRYRLHVGHIVLSPIGGMVMVGQSRFPRAEFVVAASGPLVNLGLATLALAAYLALGGPLARGLFVPFGSDEVFGRLWDARRIGLLILYDLAGTQIFLFLFNVLMVAYPMDGGRMLFAFLWARRGYVPALTASCRVAKVLAIVMALAAVALWNVILVVVALFVWMQAHTTQIQVENLGGAMAPDARFERIAWEANRQLAARGRRREGPIARWRRARRERKLERILVKVRDEGITSLSARERGFLRKVKEE